MEMNSMKKIVALVMSVLMVFVLMASAAAELSPPPKNYYDIEVSVEGSGDADTSDEKVEVNSDGTVTLTATRKQGYFTRWIIEGEYEILNGGTLEDSTIVIRPVSDIQAIASFSVDEDYLTVTVETLNNKKGTATVNGGTDPVKILKGSGGQATLVAAENEDKFIEWQLYCEYEIVSGSLNEKTLVIVPLTDVRAVARFNTSGGPNPDDGGDSPQTGDALPYVLVIMAAALGVAVVAGIKLKKAH